MGKPKALLTLDNNETFAGRLVRVLSSVANPVVLVTGAVSGIEIAEAITIQNPNWQLGQLTSLQAGFRTLPASSPAALFCPVDCPLFRQDTVERLWEAYQRTQALFVIPRTGNKRGHPVLASKLMIHKILALPETGQARDVVHQHVDDTEYVDVDDPGIFSDIDTPQDYDSLRNL